MTDGRIHEYSAGERLALHTDGVTETRNAEGEHFGSRRFLVTRKQTRHSALDKDPDTLAEGIEGWRGDTSRHNYVSMWFVELPAPPGRQPRRLLGQYHTGKEVS